MVKSCIIIENCLELQKHLVKNDTYVSERWFAMKTQQFTICIIGFITIAIVAIFVFSFSASAQNVVSDLTLSKIYGAGECQSSGSCSCQEIEDECETDPNGACLKENNFCGLESCQGPRQSCGGGSGSCETYTIQCCLTTDNKCKSIGDDYCYCGYGELAYCNYTKLCI